MKIYFSEAVFRESQTCVDDITAPTFAGISSITAKPNGSITVGWSAGTDVSSPIRYEVYVQASTATGLFNLANISYVTYGTSIDIYQLSDLTRLIKNTTYHVGVRAVDAVNNRETNVVSMNAISTGVLDDDLATIAASIANSATIIDTSADKIDHAANIVLTTIV